ncbi:MAG: ATP-dependent RNA helicase HrpA [Phycisphaerales bacterium]|nr:ATP-dependent RNA helicase HrpA [Phycisphaerales bacterium]MCB9836418.1 ATP-dependent RNA helicase HrpA [Phycisphaera sp.]
MPEDHPPRKRKRRGKSLGGQPAPVGRDLSECFGPDRGRIISLLRQSKNDQAERLIAESIQRLERRRQNVPPIQYPEELPFTAHLDELRKAIDESQVIVVSGETGSGKSTQLPKLLLEMGRGVGGLIGHTQPRRLAARAVADRVSSELGIALGTEVGYKVRFGDHTSEKTLIKLMTDGILLAESRSDRLLRQYDAIIIDEAHERSLNIDFLLGYLTRILHKRPDLKLVITSATIDAERFSAHFSMATHAKVPVVEVTGRSYPVEVLYRPIDDAENPDDATLSSSIVSAIEELSALDRPGDPGDVLVFLPGEREIREAAHIIRRSADTSPVLRGCEVLPLYARLSPSDQQRIFRRHPGRRIVLSTNVAETSLTVPGIRYVVDSGLARMNRYSARRKIESLQIEPISRASARQRAGRCGRTEPGVCVRLYRESDHDGRDEFTPPEILRTNLAGVILQMQSLGLGRPQDFPFIEPPDGGRINDAYDTLYELNAVDKDRQLTPEGKLLARLPVDPRIGRILHAASEEGVLSDALVVASFLEVQDPRERPFEKRDAADNYHAKFKDKASDFVTVLKLWEHYHKLKDEHSRSQLRKQCAKEYLSYQRLREWTDTHRQLRDLCREAGIKGDTKKSDDEALHRAILAGSLSGLGKKHHEGGFSGARAGRFWIHPSSAVPEKDAKWVVAAELVRTTKLYARSVARIDPAWIDQIAGHLITREYAEPEYFPERGRVEARATVKLWDLVISQGRLVDFGSVDREAARKIFIEEALVEGLYESGAKYEKHNAAFLAEAARNEAKLRSGRIPDREILARFYDRHLPPDISTNRAFDRWRRVAEREHPKLLYLTQEDLEGQYESQPDEVSYPDTLPLPGGSSARLEYTHAPGDETDGVRLSLPVELAASFDPDRAEWLIPGWLSAKVESVLRGLPRETRRQIDIVSVTQRVAGSLDPDGGGFHEQLARAITAASSVTVTPEMCQTAQLDDHHRMLVEVVDDKGNVLKQSRDARKAVEFARKRSTGKRSAPRSDDSRLLTDWPAESFAPAIIQSSGGVEVLRYPALVDAGTGVVLRHYDDEQTARFNHTFGVRRLAGLRLWHEIKRILPHTPHVDRARMGWAAVKGSPKLDAELGPLVADWSGAIDGCDSALSMQRVVDEARSELASRLNDVVAVLARSIETHRQIVLTLDRSQSAELAPMHADIRFQLGQLVHAGTLTHVRAARLRHYPRYLEAIARRLASVRGQSVRRDAETQARIMVHWRRCIEHARKMHELGLHDPELDNYRWMIEEYRVSQFAQQLGTPLKISEKILDEQWRKTRSL